MLNPGRLITNTNQPMTHDWPADVLVQGGTRGVVFSAKGDYQTAFVEAFPNDTFLRGEGPDIAAAEEACWAKYQTLLTCPHPAFEARAYRNGSGYCVECGTWFPQRITGLPINETPPDRPGLLDRIFTGTPGALGELADRIQAVSVDHERMT